jgi:drug/metabolite transporter (DMT)-like permease
VIPFIAVMVAGTMSEQVQGTCFVVGAAMVFALVALVVKTDTLPLLPATECRFAVSWAVAIIFMLMFRKERGLSWFGPAELRKLLVLKSFVSFGFITLWWAALRKAPLGDCIAIIYSSPVLTSIWSLLIDGEQLTREFPIQVALVATGVIFVVNPPFIQASIAPTDANTNSPDFTLVFLSLILCSLAPLVTRRTRACSWIEVEHVGAFLACAVLDPALMCVQFLVQGVVPAMQTTGKFEVVLILLAALGSFVGIAMETKGYQMAEPGKAAMFRYVEVPFAYLLQCLGTATPVSSRAVCGSVLILSSCVLGAYGHHKRNANTKCEPLLPTSNDEEVKGA